MSLTPPVKPELLQSRAADESHPKPNAETVLCSHCLRTATNGIKCQGKCVADSDY